MKKKKLTLTLFLLCVAVLSASCNSEKSSSSKTSVVTDTSSAVVSSEVSDASSETDNKKTTENNKTVSDKAVSGQSEAPKETQVTVINVTDDKGAKVTDAAGKPVTEVALIDQSNNIITDAMGNNVPPNIAGNSVNFEYGSLLWMAGHHSDSQTGKNVFDVIKEDGKIFAVQFKVNENAAPGNYEISFQRKTSSGSGAFSTDSGTGITANYSSGIISVGSAAPAEKELNGFTCYFTNESAQPGETVTIYGSIKNNAGFSAFNTYFRYDSDAFTLQGIKAAGLLENKGEFMSG